MVMTGACLFSLCANFSDDSHKSNVCTLIYSLCSDDYGQDFLAKSKALMATISARFEAREVQRREELEKQAAASMTAAKRTAKASADAPKAAQFSGAQFCPFCGADSRYCERFCEMCGKRLPGKK